MQDGIINGNGDSRYLKSAIPANITHEDLVALLRAGTFPIDMNGINEDGWTQIGTALNKAVLLTDGVAAKYALIGDSATPNEAFRVIADTLISKSVVNVTVNDADGNPISGVLLDGVSTIGGEEAITNNQGKVSIALSAETDITFISDYFDIPDYVETITPIPEQIVNVTVTMPFAASGFSKQYTESGSFKVYKARTANITLIGGGTGGQGGQGGGTDNSPDYSACGVGGDGGKVLNLPSVSLAAGSTHTFTVGAGGKGGAGGARLAQGSYGDPGGNTTFDSYSSASGSASTVPAYGGTSGYGGAGGSGGTGGYYWGGYYEGYDGAAGTRSGGKGGYGAFKRNTQGLYISPQSGFPGGYGGGGGGGGGGASYYTGTGSYTYGAAGGKGGNGILAVAIA